MRFSKEDYTHSIGVVCVCSLPSHTPILLKCVLFSEENFDISQLADFIYMMEIGDDMQSSSWGTMRTMITSKVIAVNSVFFMLGCSCAMIREEYHKTGVSVK